MSIDWGKAAKAYFDELPHPRGHGLKIKEVLPAVKLASMLKFGGHAELHEAAMFWQEFAPGGVPIMALEDFEHTLDNIAPLSYRYHGRPPTMKEIGNLKDKLPHEAAKYFGDLPDKHHPDISAADMVKAMQRAAPWAREHLEREPVKSEAAYLHHSGQSPMDYYAHLKAQQQPQSDMLPPGGQSTGQPQGTGRTTGTASAIRNQP